jgi:hypothetical protein
VVVSSEREQRARALALGAADLLSRPLEGRRVAEVVLRFREGLRLGCVALIATDPRWHARLRFLLEDAGVAGRDGLRGAGGRGGDRRAWRGAWFG